MKKNLSIILVVAIIALSGMAQGEDRSSVSMNPMPGAATMQAPSYFQGVIPLSGVPSPGLTIYVDNTAKTLQALWEAAGGTWLGGTGNTLSPIVALIVCRSKDINFFFGGSTPTFTTGVPFVAGSSYVIPGAQWVSTMKLISTTASDNVACPTHLIH